LVYGGNTGGCFNLKPDENSIPYNRLGSSANTGGIDRNVSNLPPDIDPVFWENVKSLGRYTQFIFCIDWRAYGFLNALGLPPNIHRGSLILCGRDG